MILRRAWGSTTLRVAVCALFLLVAAEGRARAVDVFPPDVERWRLLVYLACDWPVDEALQVIAWESGGNPRAVNARSGAAGLWQILPPFARKHGLADGDESRPWPATLAACAEWQADVERYGFGWWDWEAPVCRWRPASRAAREQYAC